MNVFYGSICLLYSSVDKFVANKILSLIDYIPLLVNIQCVVVHYFLVTSIIIINDIHILVYYYENTRQ